MSTKTEILSDLTTLRDEARVQAHLLSMDAQQGWQELETQLEELEHRLEQGAESLGEAALASARGLAGAVKSFFKEHDVLL